MNQVTVGSYLAQRLEEVGILVVIGGDTAGMKLFLTAITGGSESES